MRHEPWLSIRLAYRCSDRSLVEEAVQDTFVAGGLGRPVPGDRTGRGVDLGDRDSSASPCDATTQVAARRLIAQRSPELLSAEDELLVGVEHGDVGLLWPVVAGAADGGAGHRARRAQLPGGGSAARHSVRHGEDTNDAGEARDAGGIDMTASTSGT